MELTSEFIVEKYCNQILEDNQKPTSVFSFCKVLKIEEKEFYSFFSSFEAIEEQVFVSFHENTIALLVNSESYLEADSQNKLLSYYFTYFETLLVNRSLVLTLLPLEEKKTICPNVLKLYKKHFQLYIDSLDIEFTLIPGASFGNIQSKSIREIAWVQMYLILKYWINDDSPSFENTDSFIEKSVKASFDLIQKNPFESLLDLGKFLYREKSKIKI